MKGVLLAVLLFASQGFAKTLIISDIDDTLKAAHVRDNMEMVKNAFITTLAFKGMSETFTEVLRNSETEIVYVTNALEWLMKASHTEFIGANFPLGKIYFRNGSAETHKYNTIKRILKDPSIDRLILVGDNAEQDISFYHQISQEFQDRMEIHTYIRIAYALPTEVLPLKPNQKGFASPLELLADLTKNSFIPYERYLNVAEKLSQEILLAERTATNGPQYFPWWMNCRGFEPLSYPGLKSPIIEKGLQKVRSICQ